MYFPPFRVPKLGRATENLEKEITGNFSDSGICTVQQSVTLSKMDMGLTSDWHECFWNNCGRAG